ncbi:MAG TPA: SH3 domain-containing protein [Kiritimatiellia bacterium]|nr:SH3 domain-containing protein [Kiritimatiellia bacterium]
MKWISGTAVAVALFAAVAAASAESRMQVSAASTPIYSQPSTAAPPVGQAARGEVLFVSQTDGDWAAIAPPDRIDLWLNRDFIEGNRVLARSIQVRAGPGIQYDVVGTLERGAPVMPRGEEGEWARIAPPSSAILWVRKADLSAVQARTEEPIREVAPVVRPEPAAVASAAPAPAPETKPIVEQPPPPAPKPEPKPEPAPRPEPAMTSAPAPAPAPPRASKPVQPTPRIAPSTPQRSTAAPTVQAPSPRPAPAPAPPSPAPVLRPATALPAPTTPAAPSPAPASPPTPRRVARSHRPAATVPAPAATVAAQRSPDVDVAVDQDLVDDLDLIEAPNQGRPVQVEGELRAAPFLAASPSRYRLLAYDDQVLTMVCHIHGRSAELRRYIGKKISIRGREFWVELSDMPVVVVGQIVPLAPDPVDEPVLF